MGKPGTTKVEIKDTGKRSVDSASAEETEIANSGNWLELPNVTNISMNIENQGSDEPSVSKFENDDDTEIYGIGTVDKSGITIPSWTLNGKFDVYSEAGLKNFAKLVRLAKTKGVKRIRGGALSDEANPLSILNYVNYYDDYYQDQSKSASSQNSGIYVRIFSLTADKTADADKAKYSLELRETS